MLLSFDYILDQGAARYSKYLWMRVVFMNMQLSLLFYQR